LEFSSRPIFDVVKKHKPDYIVHYAAQAINGVSFRSSGVTMREEAINTPFCLLQ
jgi:hypothetical protein